MIDWGLLTGPATYLATDCDVRATSGSPGAILHPGRRTGYPLHWPERSTALCTAQAEITLVF